MLTRTQADERHDELVVELNELIVAQVALIDSGLPQAEAIAQYKAYAKRIAAINAQLRDLN